MRIETLEELRVAGHDVNKLLNNPARFMSVAKIGPKKAYEIYKQLGRTITLEQLEKIYHKIEDKKKYKGTKIPKKTIPRNIKISKEEKVKYGLNILQNHKIPFQELIGSLKVILGTTGTGKSNTVAVLIEEFHKYGLPTHIIDVEGEHKSFVTEKGFKLLDKNNYKPDPQKNWEKEESNKYLEAYLKDILQKRESLVVDPSSFPAQEDMKFLKDYLDTLWNLEDKLKSPLCLVIEEVHTLVPQTGKTLVKKKLQDFAKRGRKRKIEVIFVTQRSQDADKGVITQAEVGFLHRVDHPANLEIYKTLIPDKELFNKVKTMERGEVIYVNKGKAIRDKVRKRHTTHTSETLTIEDLKPKKEEANTDVI